MIKVISKILHEVGVFAQNSTVYGNPSDDDDGKSTRSHKEVSATEGERAERKTRSHCRSRMFKIGRVPPRVQTADQIV